MPGNTFLLKRQRAIHLLHLISKGRRMAVVVDTAKLCVCWQFWKDSLDDARTTCILFIG